MVTLRLVTPQRLARRGLASRVGVLDLYYTRLWDAWAPSERLRAVAAFGAYTVYLMAASLRGSSDARRNLWECWGLGFTPAEFSEARARLFDPAALGGFVKMYERKGIHRLLNPAAFPLERNPLKNKAIFAAKCRAAGLPIPPTLTESDVPLPSDSFLRWLAPATRLILKPAMGTKGEGVRRLVWQRGGAWLEDGNPVPLEPRELARLVEAEVRAGAVLQHAVGTHAELAALSPGALPTLRIVTCIDEAGRPEIVERVLRLSARDDVPVDNFNRGNLVAPVDAYGVVGTALRKAKGGALVETDVHPTTGAPIAGFRVPMLAACERLALSAHQHFARGFTVIGWDVGLGEVGPVLIEGNWNHGTDIVQLASRVPLEETRLGELYAHHLGRLPAEVWRAASPIQREPRR